MAISSVQSSSQCCACKFLKRRCTSECIFAPYFPPSEPQWFSDLHIVYGGINVTKFLRVLPRESRQDAVNSLLFEASVRMKDPVNGCLGAILTTEQRISTLQTENEILLGQIEKLEVEGVITAKHRGPEQTYAKSARLGTGDNRGGQEVNFKRD